MIYCVWFSKMMDVWILFFWWSSMSQELFMVVVPWVWNLENHWGQKRWWYSQVGSEIDDRHVWVMRMYTDRTYCTYCYCRTRHHAFVYLDTDEHVFHRRVLFVSWPCAVTMYFFKKVRFRFIDRQKIVKRFHACPTHSFEIPISTIRINWAEG